MTKMTIANYKKDSIICFMKNKYDELTEDYFINGKYRGRARPFLTMENFIYSYRRDLLYEKSNNN